MHTDHALSSREEQPPDHRAETPITPSEGGEDAALVRASSVRYNLADRVEAFY